MGYKAIYYRPSETGKDEWVKDFEKEYKSEYWFKQYVEKIIDRKVIQGSYQVYFIKMWKSFAMLKEINIIAKAYEGYVVLLKSE